MNGFPLTVIEDLPMKRCFRCVGYGGFRNSRSGPGNCDRGGPQDLKDVTAAYALFVCLFIFRHLKPSR